MSKYIRYPFANSGDVTEIPDSIQIDGSVSYNQGWGSDYELDPTTNIDAKLIERNKHNQLFYDITGNVKIWQEQSYYDWVSDSGGGTPFSYDKGSRVKYTDDNIYVSLVSNNTEEPSTGTQWKLLNIDSQLTVNFTSDANLTLSQNQNIYTILNITDTGVVLTTTRNIIVNTDNKILIVYNNTAQDLIIKTAAGTGITLPTSETSLLHSDGTNVKLLEVAAPVADNDIANKKYVDEAGTISTSLTFQVGATGDYATLNAAIEDVYLRYNPLYSNTQITVTLNLQSGFVMAEQILVEGLNLSWITITSVDAEVTITRSALTTNASTISSSYPAFGASKGAKLVTIGALFTMDASGSSANRDGIFCESNSSVIVLSGCGVKNAGNDGINVISSSSASIEGSIFSGAGNNGIIANNSSFIDADSADASGATNNGIYSLNSSSINADSSNASNAGSIGVYAYGASIMNIDSTDASGAGLYGVYSTSSSTISARSVNARRTVGVDASTDFVIDRGSSIFINTGTNTALGGTSVAINTLTSSGVIYSKSI